ncbi:MAG: transcription elongation factor GreA [Marinilabiliaceae bacterium]|nr:transcription elongation factor GreA [Marinilabiliaceae bacterium]
MAGINYVTAEGLKALKDEIARLEGVERPKVIQQIAEARDKGDLSENAEYDAAKEAQSHLESKIAQLKLTLANTRILDESKIDTTQVQILTKVTIRNTKTKAQMTYSIVPESEANLKLGKISVNTPIAQGLLGKKVGDTADVKVPSGIMTFEIVDITLS